IVQSIAHCHNRTRSKCFIFSSKYLSDLFMHFALFCNASSTIRIG
ncbi:hypothetical protein L917_21711, partial [Phytophthora nicotianae]